MTFIDEPNAIKLNADRRHRFAGTDVIRSARRPIIIERSVHG